MLEADEAKEIQSNIREYSDMPIQQMSGLAFLTAVKNGEQLLGTMSKTLCLQLTDVKHGHVEYQVTPNDQHLNNQGGVHGGFGATVIDAVTGGAVHSTLNAGERFSTIDLNLKMMRPLQADKAYTAVGTLINAGKNICISEAKIIDEHNKIYVIGLATLMVKRNTPASLSQ